MNLLDIPVSQIQDAQQAALMRLQLWFTGETHRILYELTRYARSVILKYASDDKLDEIQGQKALHDIIREWDKTFIGWKRTFDLAREHAAAIPFGALALYHEHYVVRGYEGKSMEFAKAPKIAGAIFHPQLEGVIQAANQRIYKDGLQLSARIWRLDQEARVGINAALMDGISKGKSAKMIAADLEQFLGAGQDCPRWTSTRLYKLTKTDIASGDRRGLITGDDCVGQGMSYNALRLARNEIQAVHNMLADQMMADQPWIQQEQINLSPSHPPIGCECEEIVSVNNGIYPKGTIILPVHPQCLCWKSAVLMDPDEFTASLRDWIQGGSNPAMDAYANTLGIESVDIAETSLLGNAITNVMGVWLWENLKDALGELL
jgi:hypothetical protein